MKKTLGVPIQIKVPKTIGYFLVPIYPNKQW